MTTAQADALQAKWKVYRKLFGVGSPCLHLSRELGQTQDGYLTGKLHCIECGEAFVLVPST